MKMKKRVLREYLKTRENRKIITPYDPEADIFEDMEEMKRNFENEVKELTKAALMTKAKEMGLEVNNRMTKADLEKLIKEA
jgi:hypothetical protein